MIHSVQFEIAGPVQHDNKAYIRRLELSRTIEEYVVQRLDEESKDVTIIGPRQVGKTSLLFWVKDFLERERGYAVAYLDMSRLNDDSLSEFEWIKFFCELLVDALEENIKRNPPIPYPNHPSKLQTYLGDLASFVDRNAILIMLDEANTVPPKMLNVFYRNIRAVQNTRKLDNKSLRHYRFAFAGVFEPDELLDGDRNSPFNQSPPIWLHDFRYEETKYLFSLVQEKHNVDIPEDAIYHVYDWTGGQPFITQMFAHIIEQAIIGNPDTLINRAFVDNMAISVKERSSANLNPIFKGTLSWLQASAAKRQFLSSMLNGSFIPDNSYSHYLRKLRLIGTIKQNGDRYSVRNRFVAHVLATELALTNSNMIINSSSDSQLGLSADLLQSLRSTLRNYNEFSNNKTLETVFIDNRISQWRDQLPQPDQKEARVEQLILLLLNKHSRDEKSALLLFLEVLLSRSNSTDIRSGELQYLIWRVSQEVNQISGTKHNQAKDQWNV